MSLPTDLKSSPLIDTRAAAKCLGLSAATLRRWRRTGYGPATVPIGQHSIRYRLEDVEAFVAACTTPDANRS